MRLHCYCGRPVALTPQASQAVGEKCENTVSGFSVLEKGPLETLFIGKEKLLVTNSF